MLKILWSGGDDRLARVFVAELADGARIELAEAIQPPLSREEKWVLIVSTLRGCPIRCPICDAGGGWRGRLSAAEILAQVDFLVQSRYPGGLVPVRKLKVQLARMGEPALNDAVLEALEELPRRLAVPGLTPSISTVAPAGREAFFARLERIKDRLYPDGRFQLQFSLHTTDEAARRRLVPVRTWSFAEMARFGAGFVQPGDRKVTLNFAPARELPLAPEELLRTFRPDRFLVKLTPINPTRAARQAGLTGRLDPADPAGCREVAARFQACGYETILSIGELAENEIGSNCGMLVGAAADRAPV